MKNIYFKSQSALFPSFLIRFSLFVLLLVGFGVSVGWAQATFTAVAGGPNNWATVASWDKTGSSTSTYPGEFAAGNIDNVVIPVGSTINIGANVPNVVASVTVNGTLTQGTRNLTLSMGTPNFSGTGTHTVTTGALVVGGNFDVATSTVTGTNTISVAGNWGVTNFTASTGTVILNGNTAQAINTATTFNNLTTSGTGDKTQNASIVVGGLLNLNGAHNFIAGAFNISLAGGFTKLATATFNGGTGTVTLTGASSAVATTSPITFYNLVISKTAANTATLASNITVSGNLTINSGSTLDPAALTLAVTGTTTILGTLGSSGASTANLANVDMQGGSISHATTGIVNIGGTLTATSGTCTLGVSTLTVTGATTIVSGATLSLNNSSGLKTFNGLVTNNGVWSNTGNSLVTFGTAGGINNLGTMTATGNGLQKFMAGSVIQGTNPISFAGAVTVSGTGNVNNTNSAIVTIIGVLNGDVAAPGSIWTNDVGSTLSYGNATAPMVTGTLRNNTNSTVNYSRANTQAIKAVNYHHLILSGGAFTKSLAATIASIDGDLTIGAGTTLDTKGFSMTVVGNTSITGTLGNSPGGGTSNLSTVSMQAGTINGSALGTITIGVSLTAASGTCTLGQATLTVSGTTAISSGVTLAFSSVTGTKTFTGLVTNNGIWSNSINSPVTFGVGGGINNLGTMTTTGTGLYTFLAGSFIQGTQLITFQGGVTVSGSGNLTNSNTAVVTIQGALDGTAADSKWVNGLNSILFYSNVLAPMATGVLDASAATNIVNYSSTSAQAVKLGTYSNLIIGGGVSAVKTANGIITVNKDLTIAASTFFADGGFAVTVKGNVANNGTHTGAGSITLNGGALAHSLTGTGDYQNLILNDALGATMGASFGVNGILTLSSGAFAVGGNTLTIYNAIGTPANLTTTSASSLTLSGTAAYTLPAITLNNLTVNSVGGATMGGSITLLGTLALSNGVLAVGANTLTIEKSPTVSSGSLTTTAASTIATSGTGANPTINIPAIATITDLTINNVNGATYNGPLLDAVTLTSGNLTLGVDVSVAGNFTKTSGTLIANSKTVTFNGAAAQVISGANNNFYGFTLNSSSTLTLSNPIFVAGNWTNTAGTFTPGTNAVTFNGVAAQTIGGAASTAFYDLTISNSTGVNLGKAESLSHTLTFTSGRLDIGAFDFTLTSTALAVSGASASSYIIANSSGRVLKDYSGAMSYVFQIGDNAGLNNYSPVTIPSSGGTGTLGVRVVNAKHPSNTSSADYLNRYWVLTSTFAAGTTFTNMTFEFLPSDKVGAPWGGMYKGSVWANNVVNTGTTFLYTTTSAILTTGADFTGVDGVAPSVVSITPNYSTITDLQVGLSTFTLSVLFNEAMDTGVSPVISFPTAGENPVSSGMLSFSTEAWSNGNKTYTATYSVTDNNLNILPLIDVGVASAKDASGNVQSAWPATGSNIFNVKLSNATVSTLTTSVATITDANVTFTTTVTFSEAMNTAFDPTISFPVEAPGGTLISNTRSWNTPTNTIFTFNYTVIDLGLNLANIDVLVAGAKDIYGNIQTSSTTNDKFNIDMANATVVSVTPSTAIVKDANVGTGTFSLTLVYDKSMSNLVANNPVVTFPVSGENPLLAPASFVINSTTWTSLTTCEIKYNVVDQNTSIPNIDVRITGGKDVNGNTPNVKDAINNFSIDTKNPTVSSITPSVVSILDGVATFSLTVVFDEAMAATAPSITFPAENPLSTINLTSGSWTNTSTYVGTYTVSDVNQTLANVDVLVQAGTDEAGNPQLTPTFADKFSIDMNNPTVSSVTPSLSTIKDANTGGTFTLTVVYSEPMGGTFPTITFPTAGENPGTTITQTGQIWSNTSTYVATFSVSDAGDVTPNIDVRVSGGLDVAGNLQTQYDVANKFSIDMANPTVLSVTPSTAMVTDSYIGTGTFSLTLVYNKAMNTLVAPTISFPIENPVTDGSLAFSSGIWPNSTTYVASYTVLNVEKEMPTIDVRVTLGQDVATNVQTQGDFADNFSVDIKNPTVTSLTTNFATIADANTGVGAFTITVVYSESMLGSVNPIITFPVESPLSTITYNTGSWTSANTFVATYNVADVNQILANIDVQVSGAKDLNSNFQTSYTAANKFNIEMGNPTVVSVTPNLTTIVDANAGTSTFTLTVTFSEAMNSSFPPTISFPVEAPGSTLSSSTSSWNSPTYTIYTYNYTVSDLGLNLANIDVMVTGAQDISGNLQTSSTLTDKFSIDMANATIVSVTPSAITVKDANVGIAGFTLTLVYDKTMNNLPVNNPIVTFPTAGEDPTSAPASFVLNSIWWPSLTTCQIIYNVTDQNASISNIDVRITGGKDANGNTPTQKDAINNFSVDTKNPTVSSITPSVTSIIDGIATFSLTVVFDEAMATTTPSITFPVENPLSTINFTSGSWTNTTTYVGNYTVTDVNQTIANVDVMVQAGTDVAGNPQLTPTLADKFSIDMNNPSVSSVTPSLLTIKDANAGGTFTITVVYAESMGGTFPTITFPTAGENPSGTITQTGQVWSLPTTYVATFSVTDANAVIPNIDVRVSGALDLGGNLQAQYNVADKFSIDMANPTVLSVTPSTTMITDSYIGVGTFSLTLVYNKAMNTLIAPTISFPIALENPITDGSLVFASGIWSNSTTYVASYTVQNVEKEMPTIDVRVTLGEDGAANVQTQGDFADNFSVDIKNPTVTTLTTNFATIVDANTGLGAFSITLVYSESMLGSINPTITFPVESPLSTITYNSGSWLSLNTFVANYNVADVNQVLANIDIQVSGAKDLNSNFQTTYTSADKFNIEMGNPTVTSVTPNLTTIVDANVGASIFTLTIVFSEPMAAVNPTVSFPVESPAGTLVYNAVSSSWTNATTFVARYNVADANLFVQNLDVSVTGGTDLATNLLTPFTGANLFSIDMTNPMLTTLTIISNNANNTALAKTGDIITVGFTANKTLSALPTATIGGLAATVVNTGGTSYTATVTTTAAVPNGIVTLGINYTDVSLNAGTSTQVNITNVSSVTFDGTAPVNQDAVFATSVPLAFGGSAVTIATSTLVTDKIWFAPAGKTLESTFAGGTTMTKATSGFATSILAPSAAGIYNLYVIDEAGNVSAISTATLTVVNTPVLATIEGVAFTYTENAAATQITNTITLTDDLDNIISATITISGNYQLGADVLSFTNSGGITGAWNATLGKLILSGASTKAGYVAALRNVKYHNTSELPSTLSRTISFLVSDGIDPVSNIVTRDITVVEVNDAPNFTSTPTTSGREGIVYTYTITGTDIDDPLAFVNYSAITIPTWLSLISVAGVPTLTGTPPIHTTPLSNSIVLQVSDARVPIPQITQQTFTLLIASAIQVDIAGGADYTAIQSAINNAIDGDQIFVHDGTYNENVILGAKAIELIGNATSPANVVINGGSNGSVLSIINSGSKVVTFNGFTLKNGSGTITFMGSNTPFSVGVNSKFGGGVFCQNSSPTLKNLIIENNTVSLFNNVGGTGGGVYITGSSSAILQDVIVRNNTAETWRGGGICIEGANPTLTNVTIDGNSGGNYGGGLSVWNASPILNNVSILNNTVSGLNGKGGGVYLHYCFPNFTNVTVTTGNSATIKGKDLYRYQSTISISGGSIGSQSVE